MRNEQGDERGDIRISIGYQKDGTPMFNVHVEASGRRTHWTGSRREELLAWVTSHLGRLIPSEESAEGQVVLDPPSVEDLDMEFVDLALEEAATPGGKRAIEASGRLRVYCHSGEASGFRIEFVLVDLDLGHKQTTAVEQGDIEPGEWSREIRCRFPIPTKGRYQIRAVVKHNPAGLVLAESVGPTLRVVE